MSEWLPAISPYMGVGLAFALGLLIGVERGWSQRLEPDGSRVAGIRTMALLGLAGGLAGKASEVSPLLGAALILVAAAPLLIGYARAASQGDLSATTAVVGAMTLGLGLLAATGHMALASISAAVMAVILAQRKALHAWLARLSEPEIQAIAQFALISLAVIPLLPDQDLGPLNAWNPRQIWMVVVLVSGLSLVGYGISKRLGPGPGWLATAAAGALVSSTAVTAACAARLRRGEGDEASLTAGIALASAIMFARVMVLVAVLSPFAFAPLACIAGPAALSSLAYAFLAYARRRETTAAGAYEARNPFDIGPALVLAAIVMAISVAARWMMIEFGDAGLVATLAISGMVDVDAAIITMSGLPAGSLSPLTAGLILAAPILANTLVKAVITFAVARGWRGFRAAIPLILSLAVGAAGAAVTSLIFPG